jgi:aminopeptidase N
MSERQPRTIYLKDYRPPPYLIDTVDLHFDLQEEFATVKARLCCLRNQNTGPQVPLVLDGRAMELVALALNDHPLKQNEYRLDSESLTIFKVPDQFTLDVITKNRPQDNTSLEGLYKSSGMFCTQCESQGFRKIAYFIDRPDVMARYHVVIVADRDKYPVLLSNGNLTEKGDLPDNKHYAVWQDPYPKPSYLFALVAGDLALIEDSFITSSGRKVDLQIYVEHHNHDKCGHAMQSLKKAMQWDEEVYGLEYDLDRYMIVAADDFNMGAMENKGLNVFNSKYVLAKPETATDDDYEGIEAVIAHEYFHNWTGNRVTCRDWFQLSLKEGLTVFRDQEFSADMSSGAVKRISDVRLLRNRQFSEDAGPMAHPVRPDSYMEINNFYTLTVYEKGGEIIRMLQTLLGREVFLKGVALYLQRYDGQAVTTDDFVRAMEDANNVELGQFRLWYSQAGTPELHITGAYDCAAAIYTLHVRQTCPKTPGQSVKEPLHIPLSIGLLGKDGKEIPLHLEGGRESGGPTTRVIEIKKNEEEIRLVHVPTPPVPSLLRGFSAPVKLHFSYSREELLLLMTHDPDPFNRWEAGQRLAFSVMMPLIETWQFGVELSLNNNFLAAFKNILISTSITDNSFKTLLLTLPSEEYLGGTMDVIDVDAIHTVREFVLASAAAALRDELLSLYHANSNKTEYRFDSVAVGRRRLKNLCLAYLLKVNDDEAKDLCVKQFHESNNMTDTLAALRILAHSNCIEKREVLEAFYDTWKNDVLVMDKWFAIQATAPLPTTLDEVKKLLRHASFSIVNPNRVRALIGAFCTGNPVSFHDKSGSGYEFLADQILTLDPLNPQIAARLLQGMSNWRRYDKSRRKNMKKQLERVAGNSKLSKDVYEVAAKSLMSS